jgi:flagellar hook-length control protein FliK
VVDSAPAGPAGVGSGVAPTAGTPPVTGPTATPPATSAAPTSSVAQQVFDRIERLSRSGNGTHRVTLRLDPGTLGEVRVQLTVTDGRVRVRMAAGAEARAALTQGAPDLQRLLAGHGTSEVHVAVTGVGASAETPGQGFGQPAGEQPSHHPHDLTGTQLGSEGSGSGTGQHEAPARTRGAAIATDGDQDRVQAPGSTEPRTNGPLRGVDVRM